MPNCFSLTRRSNLEQGPIALQKIDEEICTHFNLPCDAKKWHHGWYGYIGFLIALGKDWDWLTDDINKCIAEGLTKNDDDRVAYWQHMQDIRRWLEENFTYNAWAEIEK